MIQEWLQAFTLIFIAEMGDKTQILAMAFATQFPVGKVLLGIFLGSLANHGLAVLLGSYLSVLIPLSSLQIVAGVAFLVFAFWTLRPEEEEDSPEAAKGASGPVLTVALAFFIGELGDKTQLAAITLAADAQYLIAILAGTVTGMVITGGLGIIAGKKLGDKIPELALKLVAASVFIIFGLQKLWQSLPESWLTLPGIVMLLAVVFGAAGTLSWKLWEKDKAGRESLLRKRARKLQEYYNHMEKSMAEVCLGAGTCGPCEGIQCPVGSTKNMVEAGQSQDGMRRNALHESWAAESLSKKYYEKTFEKNKLRKSLAETLAVIYPENRMTEDDRLEKIRQNLEILLWGTPVGEVRNLDAYIEEVESRDPETAAFLREYLESSFSEAMDDDIMQ